MADEDWWEDPEEEPEEEDVDLSPDEEEYFGDDFGEVDAYEDE